MSIGVLVLTLGWLGLAMVPHAIAAPGDPSALPPSPPNPDAFQVKLVRSCSDTTDQIRLSGPFSTNLVYLKMPESVGAATRITPLKINATDANSTVVQSDCVSVQLTAGSLFHGLNEIDAIYQCNGAPACAGAAQVAIRKSFIYAYPWFLSWNGSIYIGDQSSGTSSVDLLSSNHSFKDYLTSGEQPPTFQGNRVNLFGVYQRAKDASAYPSDRDVIAPVNGTASQTISSAPLPSSSSPFAIGQQGYSSASVVHCTGSVTLNGAGLNLPLSSGSCDASPFVFSGGAFVGKGTVLVVGGNGASLTIGSFALNQAPSGDNGSLSIIVDGPVTINGDISYQAADSNIAQPSQLANLSLYSTRTITIQPQVTHVSGLIQGSTVDLQGVSQ